MILQVCINYRLRTYFLKYNNVELLLVLVSVIGQEKQIFSGYRIDNPPYLKNMRGEFHPHFAN